MSCRELREHMLQAKEEPWGDWWRAVGLLAAEIRNAARQSSSQKFWMPWEIVNVPPPEADELAENQPPAQSLEEIAAIFAAGGNEVKRVEHH